MTQCTINDELVSLERSATLADALKHVGAGERGTAIALNGTVVPRTQWSRHHLKDGDTIEIISIIQGG